MLDHVSREHEVLLDDVRTTISAQVSVIRRIEDDVRAKGFDEEARRLRECAAELGGAEHPMDGVRCVVPILRSIAARLAEAGLNTPELRVSDRLRTCATSLSRRHDRVLTETQPIDESDKPSKP